MYIDQQQFKKLVSTLDTNSLNELINRAKSMGISEKEIREGIQFIKKIKEE